MRISKAAITTDPGPETNYYLTIDGVPIPGAQAVSIGNTLDDCCQEVHIVIMAKKVELSVEDVEEQPDADEPELAEDLEFSAAATEEEENSVDCDGCLDAGCTKHPEFGENGSVHEVSGEIQTGTIPPEAIVQSNSAAENLLKEIFGPLFGAIPLQRRFLV